MRRLIAPAVALTAFGGLFATPGLAQRGAAPRGLAAPRPAAVSGRYANEPDLLRPYASTAAAEARPYTRSPSRPAVQRYARPAARPQGVYDYFPTMRTGQGPNRNVINPHSLCVPGRRALIPTGR